ncbi:MAG: DUF547 domain-containing protein [Zetaproteobacteria bacterium]|nr:DUF547 domain-containing protein [Zetaproteobacteria bacterium]
MKLKIAFAVWSAWSLAGAAAAFDHQHPSWSQVLEEYVNPIGLVDYERLKRDHLEPSSSSFVKYIAQLRTVSHQHYQSWTLDQKKAFLINAYNALTIKLIIDNMPVESITDLGGWWWWLTKKPWKIEFFMLLDGHVRSLQTVQNSLRSEEFADYRIHAAISCASLSCPPLKRDAYVATTLDEDLDMQMKIWLADPERNDFSRSKIKISKIFAWYQEDFNHWGGSVHMVLLKFAPAIYRQKIQSHSTMWGYLPYNWDLNIHRK